MPDKQPLIHEKSQPHIDELFAFVVVDKDGEGILAFANFDNPARVRWEPMIGADLQRVDSLKKIAQKIMQQTNVKKIEIVKFSNREVIEVLTTYD